MAHPLWEVYAAPSRREEGLLRWHSELLWTITAVSRMHTKVSEDDAGNNDRSDTDQEGFGSFVVSGRRIQPCGASYDGHQYEDCREWMMQDPGAISSFRS